MLAEVPVFWFFVFWLTAMGGAVGSFLNVVVYRLPLKLSLIYPPSHCPKCGEPIAWYDNVPVFGWIVLRGRCRTCRNPISMRYPLIEAVTAAIFGAMALAELPRLGLNEAYGVYPYHAVLLCTLLCAGLIEYDGNRTPWRLFLPVLIAGIVGPWLWPELHATWDCVLVPDWLDVLTTLGVLVLVVIAGYEAHARRSIGLLMSLICVGLCIGRPGVQLIATATVVAYLLLWLLRRAWPKMPIPTSMAFGLFTLVWVLVWTHLGWGTM